MENTEAIKKWLLSQLKQPWKSETIASRLDKTHTEILLSLYSVLDDEAKGRLVLSLVVRIDSDNRAGHSHKGGTYVLRDDSNLGKIVDLLRNDENVRVEKGRTEAWWSIYLNILSNRLGLETKAANTVLRDLSGFKNLSTELLSRLKHNADSQDVDFDPVTCSDPLAPYLKSDEQELGTTKHFSLEEISVQERREGKNNVSSSTSGILTSAGASRTASSSSLRGKSMQMDRLERMTSKLEEAISKASALSRQPDEGIRTIDIHEILKMKEIKQQKGDAKSREATKQHDDKTQEKNSKSETKRSQKRGREVEEAADVDAKKVKLDENSSGDGSKSLVQDHVAGKAEKDENN